MFTIGTIINDRFEIKEYIGSGLTGVVFSAIDKETSTNVILKFLHKNFYGTKEETKELTQYLLKARLYEHPLLVRIYEVGQFQNFIFISMEDLGNISLETIFNYKLSQNKVFTAPEILFIFDKLTSIIQYIHLSTIFKNIKPSNIFLRGDILKISGFAMSFLLDWNNYPFIYDDLKKTQYTAHELTDYSSNLGKEVDVYSLGVIFYELYTMTPLKSDENVFTRMNNIPDEVRSFIDNSIAKSTENRIGSVSSFFNLMRNLSTFKNIQIPNSISFYVDPQFIHPKVETDSDASLQPLESKTINLNVLKRDYSALAFQSINLQQDSTSDEKSVSIHKFEDEATILTPEEELQRKLKIIKESQQNSTSFKYGYPAIMLIIFTLFIGVIFGYNQFKKRKELSQERINQMLLNQISEQNRIENEMRLKAIAEYQKKLEDKKRIGEEDTLVAGEPLQTSDKKCPQNMVYVRNKSEGGFCIDLHEYPNIRSEIPISNVSYDEATFFCRVKEKRLCTINELKEACDSGNGSYPYGEVWQNKNCNDDGAQVSKSGVFTKCFSKRGIYDLSGNLAEWVDSATTGSQTLATTFGGSYIDNHEMTKCKPYKSYPKKTKEEFIGFRCCKNGE